MIRRNGSSTRSRPEVTVGAALEAAARTLAAAGVREPRSEAAYLLGHLLGCDRGGLVARRDDRLDLGHAETLELWIARRAAREPAQHLTGVQEFHGLEFKVDRRALVPRPETEDLVDAVLGLDLPSSPRIADLGTGSGCIAVTLAVLRPDARLTAIDRSAAALELARSNARDHGVERQIEFVCADMLHPAPHWSGVFDAVASNPPYVGETEWSTLEPEVRDHDPRVALVGGIVGHETIEALLSPAHEILRPGGMLVIEIGLGQSRAVSGFLAVNRLDLIEIRRDLQGIERIVVAARPGGSV